MSPADRPSSSLDARALAALGVNEGRQRSGRDVLINASQIAELAGVGRPAVSNWRRRHDDFPEPASRTPNGADLWRLGDVQRWLAARGGAEAGTVTPEQHFAIAFNAARAAVGADEALRVGLAGLALATVLDDTDAGPEVRRDLAAGRADRLGGLMGTLVELGQTGTRTPAPHELLGRQLSYMNAHTWTQNAVLVDLIASACALDAGAERVAACEDALAIHRKGMGRRKIEFETSDDLAALVAHLAGPAASYADPAAGVGTMLLHAARMSTNEPRLLAAEPDVDRMRINHLRMIIHELHVALHNVDALQSPMRNEDGSYWLEADVVLCEPPFAQRVSNRAGEYVDEDISWTRTPRRHQELRWLQRVVELLNGEDARGYVVLPSSVGTGPEVEVRAEIVRRGMIEAVIELGEHVSLQQAGAVSIWVVRPERPVTSDSRVLFVDARSAVGNDAHARGAVPEAARDLIVTLLQEYRAAPTRFAARPDQARAVPVLEILGPDTPLAATAWTLIPPDALTLGESVQAFRHRASEDRAALDAITPPDIRVAIAAEERGVCLLETLIDAGWCVRVEGDALVQEGDVAMRVQRTRLIVEAAPVGERASSVDGIVMRAAIEWLPAGLLYELVARSGRLTGPSRSGLAARVAVLRFSEEEMRSLAPMYQALEQQQVTSLALAESSAALRESLVTALMAGAVQPQVD